ncbi:MAG: bifunctional 4-hydroxy-2-oxoglutarate aldolase/2-dehydro-3-deoxy-phosphogluconate aldolase [Deltaproteobacteria bacterium]|nr:bifunctional 4-hydroxy-2-oxoglutarate aldolase/2-dehydro-3-deoxy-phosphogluconate aldolase [Deltaproteobacteria bacterium]
MNSMDFVKQNKIFAVIRADDSQKALEFAKACIEGGLKLIEITFSFPGAEEVISKLSERRGALVGAGTVLNLGMARSATNSGARFIISPHTDSEIISYSKSNNLMVVSGALTSNEIVKAWNLGVDMVKIFPVKAVGGASYIKAIKEPLPFIEIMTTGGVTVENFTEFLSAGATAVGLSSTLIGSDGLFNPEVIYQRAKRVVEKLIKT